MFGQDLCYTQSECTGISFPSPSARECCANTEEGQSFQINGICVVEQCIGEDHYIVIITSIHKQYTLCAANIILYSLIYI